MPRDVFPGEGYDGDVQLAHHTPGHHNGEFWLDDGSSTLLNMGDIPDQGYFGVGNSDFDRQRWAMGGMGGLLDDLWTGLKEVVGGSKFREIDQKMGQLQDGIVAVYKLLDTVIPEIDRAMLVSAQALAMYGPASPQYISSLQGIVASQKLLMQATRFEIVCSSIGDSLKPKAKELASDLSSVTGLINSADRLREAMFQRVYRKFPDTYNKRQKAFQRATQIFSARFGTAVAANTSSEGWLGAITEAVNEVIPQEVVTKGSGVSGMGDPVTVIVLIIAAGIVLIGILLTLNAILGQFNKTNTQMVTSRSEFEARLSEERKEFFTRGQAAGKPLDQLNAEWAAMEAKKLAEQKEFEAKLKSDFDLGSVVTYGAIIAGAAFILPMILKKD
jgi:hypothetical protein